MKELKDVIKKVAGDHEEGCYLPEGFMGQYYDVLIQRGFEEPTFEDLLKESKSEEEKQKVLEDFSVRVKNFITDLLSDEEDDEDWEDDFDELFEEE